MRTYSLEYRVATLHRLQTSSVTVVKECLHTVDVAMADKVSVDEAAPQHHDVVGVVLTDSLADHLFQ